MNYDDFYNYIEDIVANVSPEAKWFHGRKDLITPLNPSDLLFFCFPLTATGIFVPGGDQFIKEFEINIFIYKKDSLESGLDQNNESAMQDEIKILSETFFIAESFVRRFNYNTYTDALERTSERLKIIGRPSFGTAIKDTPHVLTGTFITMRVEVPDDFDYCPPTP